MTIAFKNNGLNLDAIAPSNGAKYSPNLYRWLTARGREYRARMVNVYTDENGTLWIGYSDDLNSFIGQKLIAVLCQGVKADSGCWCGLGQLNVVPEFWQSYMRDGRCAIDTEHKMFFMGDETRWKVDGDSRQCLWCGNSSQVLRRWTKTVECSEWTKEETA